MVEEKTVVETKDNNNYKYCYEMSFIQYWDTYGDEDEIIQATDNYEEYIVEDNFLIHLGIVTTEENESLVLSTVFISYYTNKMYPTLEDYEAISKSINNRVVHFNEIKDYRLELSLNLCKLLQIKIKRLNGE